MWLSRLYGHYQNPAVVGVGGRVVPEWETGRPAWFPPEFDWVVGCTYRGMPDDVQPVRNLVGANMSFRRDVLLESGGFSNALGRVGSTPLGCEETELCIRITHADQNATLLFEPEATVHHLVPSSRATWRYFRSRCYSEGLSKAEVRARAGTRRSLRNERSYLIATIPSGIALAVASIWRGRLAGVSRAGTIVGGAGATISGYLVGRAGVGSRSAPAPRRPADGKILAATGPAAAIALPVGLLLWVVSLIRVDLAAMSDIGLVSILPVTFWLGLLVLTAGFGIAVTRPAPSRWLLAAYLIALVLILHGTPTLLYGTLRYAWAWKHVGLIDYLLRHGDR